ncbi:M23 family metallopeptidase [Rubidibacter lacunae]|nr:M23 family metallopeptidase [Rubidibacter lacunae]
MLTLAWLGLQSGTAIAQSGLPTAAPAGQTGSCRPSVLSQLERHTVSAGETISSIAARYGLYPGTIARLNPGVPDAPASGMEVLVPPFNGMRLEVPSGTTWNDLETAYGVRADVLFELNGCTPRPESVFLPGVNWSPTGRVGDYNGFDGYPLPERAEVTLAYGPHGRGFHSGLDLQAAPGTPVLAVAAGTTAFVGPSDAYGNLVIVNHPDGRQTRYAHLGELGVTVGQPVVAGQQVGTVGTSGVPDARKPHLHFEIRIRTPQGWVAQDPVLHLIGDRSNPETNRYTGEELSK